MMGIYKITNKITGEAYIGQSKDIKRRWNEYKTKMHTNMTKVLYQAMREYGIENFSFEVLEECSQEDLLKRERYYIQKYNTENQGYNMRVDENLQKEIDQEIVNQIKEDLKNLKLTQRDISNKYDVSYTFVSLVNSGKIRYDENYFYPIRPQIDNTKKNHYCIDCGKEISKGAVRCDACAKLKSRVVERPNREELKKLIRNNSFMSIGKMYNVSDNSVRKWCKVVGLPTSKKMIDAYTEEQWENEEFSALKKEDIVKNNAVDKELICDMYKKLQNCQQVANNCNCSVDSVRRILKEKNISVKDSGKVTQEKCGVSIDQYDLEGNYIQSFPSYRAVAQYFIDNGYSKAKAPQGILRGIKSAIENDKPLKGFKWKFKN